MTVFKVGSQGFSFVFCLFTWFLFQCNKRSHNKLVFFILSFIPSLLEVIFNYSYRVRLLTARSDLVGGVHTRASVKQQSRETQETRGAEERGHLFLSE